MEKLLLIDGNSLFNRAFYATPGSFSMKDGTPTNAIFGFTNMLLKAITDFSPKYIAVAFDVHAPTFRHKMYDGYKATRHPMPEELRVQVPLIKKMLSAMKIKYFELEGYEADDIVGTLALAYQGETVVLTGDNDYLQLISDTTTVYITKKGITDLAKMDVQNLFDEKGLTPSQIIDLKSLMGDTSDNIPGVKGVGEKTALNLIATYGTREGVYEHIDEIKGALKTKLIDGEQSSIMSKTLATINCNVPIDYSLDEMTLVLPFPKETTELFEKFEFKSLLKRTEFFDSDGKETEAINIETITIDNIDDLRKVIKENADKKELSFDEKSLTFAFSPNCCYKVLLMLDFFSGVSEDALIKELAVVFENEKVEKTVYDKKAFTYYLEAFGITAKNVKNDLSLMQYVVNFESTVNTLPALLKYYGYEECVSAGAMLAIKDNLKNSLKELDLESLYYDVELPLTDVLFDMEKVGFTVDSDVLDELEKRFGRELSELTDEIHNAAGEDFNINSPKQLGEVLSRLGLLQTKKGGKAPSTAADVLEKIEDKHPVVPLILRYRKIAKLMSTYVLGLRGQISSDNKIHTVFNQALTVTGRLSSKEPNLQNIPVRTDDGKDLRKLFVPSKAGNLIVSADYSQIELRLLAHFSKDEELLQAYNESRDIHAKTASSVFGVPLDEVTDSMRRASKAVNFGIIYGISDYGLANQLHITRKQAGQYIARYFEMYPAVKAYMDGNVEKAKTSGYVSTITGRRRVIKEIRSNNFVQRSFGERAAMNMPLQGSAADIIKIAMNKVYARFMRENIKSKLILQVHDELIVDCLPEEFDKVNKILKEEMESAVKLNVPLTVNIAYGESWYEAK